MPQQARPNESAAAEKGYAISAVLTNISHLAARYLSQAALKVLNALRVSMLSPHVPVPPPIITTPAMPTTSDPALSHPEGPTDQKDGPRIKSRFGTTPYIAVC